MLKAKSKLDFLSALSPGMTAIFNPSKAMPSDVLPNININDLKVYELSIDSDCDVRINIGSLTAKAEFRNLRVVGRVYHDASKLIGRSTKKASLRLSKKAPVSLYEKAKKHKELADA